LELNVSCYQLVSLKVVAYFETSYRFLCDVLLSTKNSAPLPDGLRFADHERKHLYK
jgi:hypothetical protein